MAFLRPLSRVVSSLTRQALGQKGASLAALLDHWSHIVGPQLAHACLPEGLTFPKGRAGAAMLTVRVSGSAALILQHDEPLILERINSALGYRAVEKLKYIHGEIRLPPQRPSRSSKPLPANVVQQIETMVSSVQDNELRQALQGLGEAMKNRQQ